MSEQLARRIRDALGKYNDNSKSVVQLVTELSANSLFNAELEHASQEESTEQLKPVAFMYVREGLQPVVSISPLVRTPKNATVVELIPAIPPAHRVVSVAVGTKDWADKNVAVPNEVKGRVMSEMFWRGVYAAQRAIIDNKG